MKREKGRIDFVIQEFEPIPGSNNLFRISMIPDPRVWELIEEDGKEAWYNKLDRVLIPMEEFKKAVKTMDGIPIVMSNVKVENIDDYLKKSEKRVKEDVS